MQKFIMGLPEALIESAELDGAGPIRILLQIIFPLSKPMLAALGLFTAVWHWNDWFSGAFYVTDQNLIPVQTRKHLRVNLICIAISTLSFSELEATFITLFLDS